MIQQLIPLALTLAIAGTPTHPVTPGTTEVAAAQRARWKALLAVPFFNDSDPISDSAVPFFNDSDPMRAMSAAEVVAAQRAWWQALVLADTAYLRAHSAPTLTLTLSSGRTFNRDAALTEAASHSTGGQVTVRWSDETVRTLSPTVAVVTSRATETIGPTSTTYRYLTLFERARSGWRVVAAQSTREAVFAPRNYAATAEQLAEFAGAYRTPRGLALRVVVRDSALALIEPGGSEMRMEPIASGLFEFTVLSPANGVVRLLFTRDSAGHVTSMSQLVPSGITAFPRMP